MRTAGLVIGVSLLAAGPAAGQFEAVSSFLKRIDGVSFHATGGWLTNESTLGHSELAGIGMLRGYGFEVYLRVTDPPEDTTQAYWQQVEIGVGYDQLSGIVSELEDLELYGTIRSIPSFAAYLTFENPSPVSPYAGISTGLIKLARFRGFDLDGRQYKLDSDTFELGLIGGVFFDSGIFAEASYRFRRFESIDWSFPSDRNTLDPSWPRRLDFSAFLISVGVQVNDLFN